MWRSQVEGLADVRRVLAPDLDGHGAAAGRPAADTMDAVAGQLLAALDDAGVEVADLAGFSMGGYACFAFWRLHPERVRSLVLVDTRSVADTDAGRDGRDALAARIRQDGARAAVDAMMPKMFTVNAPEHIRGVAEEMMLAQPPASLVADVMAMKGRPDSTADLGGIDVPVLVIAGDADEIAPPAEGAAMAEALPRGRLVTVAGAAHLAPMERAAEVTEAIRNHLAEVDSA
jgi:pimeloyl-ACP methyl ester carboxylesterase